MRRRCYDGVGGKEGRKRMETCSGTYDNKKEEEEGRRESTSRTKWKTMTRRRGTGSNRSGRGG